MGSVDVVDVPSQRVESSEGDLCWLSKSAACIYGRLVPVMRFWAFSSTDSFDEISGTSRSAMSQGVLRFSSRADVGVECRQDVLVHEVAAGVGDATSLQADMVHGKGEDAESGASRGRYQTATRQDKTDEDSTGDASVAGSVGSVDVARQRVECRRLSVERDSQQSSGGVSSSSHAETPMTANGVPVTMFSSNFLLMKAATPNNSSMADAGRRPVVGEHQPRNGLVTSAVPDEERTCAIQSDGESGIAVVEVDNGWSSEDRRRFWANVGLSSSETMGAEVVGVVGNAQVTKKNDVHGVRRQVVDSAYLLAAIEFESEVDRLASNEHTRKLAAQSGGDGTSVTMFSSSFLLITADELANGRQVPNESRQTLNDHIQARRRKKRLRN